MTQQQLVALILSAPFAIALTSIIRRLSQRPDGTPRLDGPLLVWGTNISLSVVGNVLLAVTTGQRGWDYAWAIGIGLGMGIMGCGLMNAAGNTAEKGQTPTAEPTTMTPKIIGTNGLPYDPNLETTRKEDGGW